mmetsp:Transcript_71782/g.181409  ORF Transcript_71782/g.181409 Transcript_71782/m.181409 type:complete len:200 (+) Transcript_71782:70-669(+)
MSYSRGVLIHNFNEDQYGRDLHSLPAPPPPAKISVSHTVHHWKVPDQSPQVDPVASGSVDRHILFGHAGDMRDPRTSLAKTEFATAHQYFMQEPKKLSGPGHLSADAFTMSDDHKQLSYSSHLATAKKQNWGDMRQSHAVPPNERFMTTNKLHFTGDVEKDPGFRMPRHYGEFTKRGDVVNLTRSTANLRTAGASALGR